MRDLDLFGIAAASGHLRLESRIVARAHRDVRVDHEDQLAPLRAEALAPSALTCLDDDRTALRGTRHGERPARAEKAALMVEAMDLFRMGEQPARLVLDDRIVLPAIPMPEHDLHKLVGPIVAQVVLDYLLAAHVLRLAVVERGDDVPGRAPVGHQIERCEQARHVERLVVARRIGRTEAEPLGGHPHDREHGHRVHLHATDAVSHRVFVVAPVHVGHR